MELAGGVDPKTISKRRGHASVAFTLNQYGHVLNSMDSAAAAAVDAIFTPTSAKVSLAR
jgi:integrase